MADIPSGRIVIHGVIIDSDMDNIDNNKIKVSVITRDPQTGETIRLDNVVLKQNNPSLPDTIGENQPVTITAQSYDAYRRRNTAAMSASVSPTNVPAINKSLPDHVKVKSKIDAFASRPSAICKSFQDKVDDMNEKMGMVYKRTDLTIIQGKESGSSPSFIIHQGNGDVCMVDGLGKQYINVNGHKGIELNAGQIDMGSSLTSKNSLAYGGQSGYENPVGDVVPNGTILTPYPKLLPNITKIMNTIIPIMDMIDLGKACMEAYKVIFISNTDSERMKNQNNISKLEQNNTTEAYAANRRPASGDSYGFTKSTIYEGQK